MSFSGGADIKKSQTYDEKEDAINAITTSGQNDRPGRQNAEEILKAAALTLVLDNADVLNKDKDIRVWLNGHLGSDAEGDNTTLAVTVSEIVIKE